MSTVSATPTDPSLPLVRDLERMRAAFRLDMTPSLATRRDRLARLAQMTKRYAPDIMDTANADFGHRSRHETLIADLLAVDEAIKYAQRNRTRPSKPAFGGKFAAFASVLSLRDRRPWARSPASATGAAART